MGDMHPSQIHTRTQNCPSHQEEQAYSREKREGKKIEKTTHVAAEGEVERVDREHHRRAVLVALRVERGRAVVVVRERRVAQRPDLRSCLVGPTVQILTPAHVGQDPRAGEVIHSV